MYLALTLERLAYSTKINLHNRKSFSADNTKKKQNSRYQVKCREISRHRQETSRGVSKTRISILFSSFIASHQDRA